MKVFIKAKETVQVTLLRRYLAFIPNALVAVSKDIRSMTAL